MSRRGRHLMAAPSHSLELQSTLKRINIRAKGLPDVGVNFYRSKRKLEINIPPESAADN